MAGKFLKFFRVTVKNFGRLIKIKNFDGSMSRGGKHIKPIIFKLKSFTHDL